MKKNLSIKYLSLDEIMPYEHNPRNNEESVELVKNSIRDFGFRQPIVVDAAGTILVGHTRYQAARELGLDKVPVTVADDLNPYEASAYRLADNKTAEHSGWDFSLLEPELNELSDYFDMEDFGFDDLDDDDMDSLLDDLFDEEEIKESDTFRLTLVFPKKEEEIIKDYVEKVGRENIIDEILKKAKK